jgi:hypothetical protein
MHIQNQKISMYLILCFDFSREIVLINICCCLQIWVIVMLLSCVPMTLSSVYKEKALGETEIDVVYLNGFVTFVFFLYIIPLFKTFVSLKKQLDGLLYFNW